MGREINEEIVRQCELEEAGARRAEESDKKGDKGDSRERWRWRSVQAGWKEIRAEYVCIDCVKVIRNVEGE